jgi:predicted Zn finger-like uncharacterized protein
MLIVCPSCATPYDVEPAILQRNGRQVRCVRCRTVWSVEMNQADQLLAAAAALAPQVGVAEAHEGAATEREEVAVAASANFSGAPQWADPSLDADWEGNRQPEAAAEPVGDGLNSGPESPSDYQPDADDPVEVEAPPIAPVDLDAGRPPLDIEGDHEDAPDEEQPEDIETAAARRYPRGVKRQREWLVLSRWQIVILVLIVVDAILIGWRRDFVRVLPQTASFYATLGMPVNLRGLSFAEVATSMEAHEGVPILVVHGDIVNDTGGLVEVPRLKFIVRNAAKQEIYSWTAVPSQPQLEAYQAEAFVARLASPPPGSTDVLVRFLNRLDFGVGER